ncbi:MAG: head GIN domain-containing protein, partial [Marinoscillum sp.]
RMVARGTDPFDAVDLRLRGHEDTTYQLIMHIESRGRNRQEAETNARNVIYEVKEQGGDFYFDSNISFPDSVPFRFQNVSATFYIPFGKTFRMDGDLEDILINTLHLNGYRSYQMESNDWVFERDGIKCLTCTPRDDRSYRRDESDDRSSLDRDTRNNYSESEKLVYQFEDFDEVRIASFFDIDISRGDEWSVMVRGDDSDLDDVYLNQVGDLLEVKFREDNWKWWSDRNEDRVAVIITMPNLEYLELIGDCEGEVRGFVNDEMNVELTGASKLFMDIDTEDLDIQLTGATNLDLRGTGTNVDVRLVGASTLEGFGFEARRISVDAIGASKAEVYGTEEIEIDAAGVSKVKYRGTSNVNINKAGITTVTRD